MVEAILFQGGTLWASLGFNLGPAFGTLDTSTAAETIVTNQVVGIITALAPFPLSAVPQPTILSGGVVPVDGPSNTIQPGQINVQAPDDTTTGIVSVVVTSPLGKATSTVTLAPIAPSLLLLDPKHVAGIIFRSDGSGAYNGGAYDIIGPTGNSLGFPTVAAKAGDAIELFGGGFGPTSPAVPAGQAFSGAAKTTNAVTVLINNVSVTPFFAGLTGAGLYQINFFLPAGLGTGDVTLATIVNGVQTQSNAVISLQ